MDTIVADFYSDVAVRQVRTEERRFDSDGSFLPGIGNVSAMQGNTRADVKCARFIDVFLVKLTTYRAQLIVKYLTSQPFILKHIWDEPNQSI